MEIPRYCKFRVFHVSKCPDFVALSYTWGPELPEHEIRIDGQPIRVRKNLWDALCEIRKQMERGRRLIWKKDLFWIDQSCVNQDNIYESNHQLALMKDIYAQAKSVLIWLGLNEAISDECAAIGLIKDISGTQLNSAAQRGYLGLCNRPYWTRM